jgi:putative MATE family efflux protein
VDGEPSSSAWPGEATVVAERAGTIWALAWPVIATFSLESLVALVDTLMVGRLGAAAVAAVGVGTQIMGAVAVTMTAVGTGTLALVARHVGAREREAAEETLAQSIPTAAALAAAAIVPMLLWAPAVVASFGVAPDVAALGAPFVRVVLCGVPAIAVMFVIAMALRGAGDTRTPLLIGATVNVVNVSANYVLIFGKLGFPALGVVGSATATVLAFSLGAGLGLLLLARGALRLRLRWRRVRMSVVRRVLTIGVPTAAEQLLMQFGFFIYLVFAARYGTSAVAAYFIGVRILALSFLPGNGFAAAAATLVGQHLGARQPRLAEESGWGAARLASYMMTPAGAAIFLFARPIANAFVADAEVVTALVSFIHVLALAQPLMAFDSTLTGALRGAGDTRYPLVSVVVGFYGCRLGCAWLAASALHLPLVWVWMALLGDYAARVALKGLRFRSGRWKAVRV